MRRGLHLYIGTIVNSWVCSREHIAIHDFLIDRVMKEDVKNRIKKHDHNGVYRYTTPEFIDIV